MSLALSFGSAVSGIGAEVPLLQPVTPHGGCPDLSSRIPPSLRATTVELDLDGVADHFGISAFDLFYATRIVGWIPLRALVESEAKTQVRRHFREPTAGEAAQVRLVVEMVGAKANAASGKVEVSFKFRFRLVPIGNRMSRPILDHTIPVTARSAWQRGYVPSAVDSALHMAFSKFLEYCVSDFQPADEPAPAPVVEAAPVLEATPVVEPTPASDPAPAPEVTPVVEAAPVLEATPVVESSPVVESTPASDPASVPEVTPVVEAAPVLEVAPVVEPTPASDPAPEPVLEPVPVVEAAPVLEATPVVESTPASDPAPEPVPERAPVVEAAPVLEAAPVVESATAPAPALETAPAPELHPEPAQRRKPGGQPRLRNAIISE